MGKLIVIEGTDGSGKATQTALLCEKLQKEGYDIKKLEFPRYKEESSALVRLYLNGAFGDNPDDVNAFASSTFFAVDRFASFKQDWGGFYDKGGVVITDRYTTANAVHQAPKLKEEERRPFTDWLFDFEYRLLGIPKPDLVIYLDMPTAVSEKMMRKRESETGTTADIHERDEGYLERCRAAALKTAEDYGWKVINCSKNGEPRRLEDISGDIFAAVSDVL